MGSVIALECLGDSLVRWLWEHGGVIWQILSVRILMCETNVLWLPWCIIKDMENHRV